MPASGMDKLTRHMYSPSLLPEMSVNTSSPVLLFMLGLPSDGTGLPPKSQVMVGLVKTLATVVALQVSVMASPQTSPLREVIAVDTTGRGRAERYNNGIGKQINQLATLSHLQLQGCKMYYCHRFE